MKNSKSKLSKQVIKLPEVHPLAHKLHTIGLLADFFEDIRELFKLKILFPSNEGLNRDAIFEVIGEGVHEIVNNDDILFGSILQSGHILDQLAYRGVNQEPYR